MSNLDWVMCGSGQNWCPLMTVNLREVRVIGVYVIWHGGNAPRVVRVGQGDIAERLARHRTDRQIVQYQCRGPLMVTWAAVPRADLDGVERFLADQLQPLIGDAFPNVRPIAVNTPF
jgi:hypothetical protein